MTEHPYVTYYTGFTGPPPTPAIRGTRIRVQTVMLCNRQWGWTPAEIAHQYDLAREAVEDALAYYEAHRQEIDDLIQAEADLADRLMNGDSER